MFLLLLVSIGRLVTLRGVILFIALPDLNPTLYVHIYLRVNTRPDDTANPTLSAPHSRLHHHYHHHHPSLLLPLPLPPLSFFVFSPSSASSSSPPSPPAPSALVVPLTQIKMLMGACSARWTTPTVTVGFTIADPDPQNPDYIVDPAADHSFRDRIMKYATAWEPFANIKFEFVGDDIAPNADVRITFVNLP